jgi:hypothetical protein
LAAVAPSHDPCATAVFSLPGTHASFVAVAGRELLRDGVLLNADPLLDERVQNTANSLQSWLRNQ